MTLTIHLLRLLLLTIAPTIVSASRGDSSSIYIHCKKQCQKQKCPTRDSTLTGAWNPKYNWLVWDCSSECGYQCMWEAVTIFQREGYDIPQFYGKWPFIRVLGVQEPASMLFSLLNGFSHLLSIKAFRRRVSPSSPMYIIWHVYAVVALNTWFWSALFHTRDTDFTEKMDYFCATSLVTFQLFSLFARLLVFKNRLYVSMVAVCISAVYLRHIYIMSFVHFDYGYHMKVNIIVGAVNALGWISWCAAVRVKQPYVWKCWLSILLVGAFLSLEVLDFPPLLWTFDAHSLWHAGTVPLGFLWYQFASDDCNYLLTRWHKKIKSPLYSD